MNKNERILIQVYLLWVIVELVLQLYREELPGMHGLFKGGLMPILILFVSFSDAFQKWAVRLLLLASLVFAWAGDLFLLYDYDERFFLAGAASFFMAQLLYVGVFHLHSKRNEKRSLLLRRPLVPLTLLGFFIVVLRQVYFDLGTMELPVLAYSAALYAMLLAALNRRGRTNELSFWLVAFGALSFVFSDALIALDRFDDPIHPFYIMSTYTLAQGLITLGLVLHKERD